MSTESPRKTDDQEIDLASISRNLGNAYNSFNDFIFRCIQFVISNIVILTLLLVAGIGLGYALDRIQRTYDHSIIVTPNFGSVDYLYAKIDLLDAKMKEGDTLFLASIGIKDPSKIGKLEITPIVDIYRFVYDNDQYFQLFKLMADNGDVKKSLEETSTSKNYPYHQITFSSSKKITHSRVVEPLLNYLNSSDFFRKIQREYVNNVHTKLRANEATIQQIDAILNGLAQKSQGSSNSVYVNENSQLNDVLTTKNDLLREQGNHRVELVSLDKIIRETNYILNMENRESLNGKMKVVLPLLFIFLFVLFKRLRHFYTSHSQKRLTA